MGKPLLERLVTIDGVNPNPPLEPDHPRVLLVLKFSEYKTVDWAKVLLWLNRESKRSKTDFLSILSEASFIKCPNIVLSYTT